MDGWLFSCLKSPSGHLSISVLSTDAKPETVGMDVSEQIFVVGTETVSLMHLSFSPAQPPYKTAVLFK